MFDQYQCELIVIYLKPQRAAITSDCFTQNKMFVCKDFMMNCNIQTVKLTNNQSNQQKTGNCIRHKTSTVGI